MGGGGGGEEECQGDAVFEGAVHSGLSAVRRGCDAERGQQGDAERTESTIAVQTGISKFPRRVELLGSRASGQKADALDFWTGSGRSGRSNSHENRSWAPLEALKVRSTSLEVKLLDCFGKRKSCMRTP